jgi:hypothetical protein
MGLGTFHPTLRLTPAIRRSGAQIVKDLVEHGGAGAAVGEGSVIQPHAMQKHVFCEREQVVWGHIVAPALT